MSLYKSPVNDEIINHDGPPSLNYDLRARIVSNIIFWSSIVITLTIMPIAIFYPLFYCTDLDIGTILGLVSIPTGLPSMVQLPFRIWKVWKQDGGDRRPLSGNTMDLFMWEYIICFIILTVVYIVSTSIPVAGLFLMIPSILVGIVSVQCFVSLFQFRMPIWISSLPPGHKLRPAGYHIMEDVVAVDGGGRSAFRRALNVRYEKSPIFQKLVLEMTIYWGIVGLIFIGVSAAITFTTALKIAFGVTLTWASIWPFFCFIIAQFWIRHRLAQEIEWFKVKNHASLD